MTNGLYEKNSLPFFKLYEFMLLELNLKGRELIIYTFIFYQIEVFDKSVISFSEIESKTNIHRENVAICVKKLEKKNLLVIEKGNPNKYSLVLGGKVLSKQQQLKEYLLSKQQHLCYQNDNTTVIKMITPLLSKQQHLCYQNDNTNKNIKDLEEIKEIQKEDTNKYVDIDYNLGLGDNDFEF